MAKEKKVKATFFIYEDEEELIAKENPNMAAINLLVECIENLEIRLSKLEKMFFQERDYQCIKVVRKKTREKYYNVDADE